MATLQEIQMLAPWLPPVVVLLFGACIGSFLNVCIYRIPDGRSVVSPRSACACGRPIAWYDNIPILSWLLLRGQARCCGRPFSIRYPAVELLTALLFLACWMQFPPAKALVGMVFVCILICATFIDLDHMIIPDRFAIGGAVVGVALSALVPSLHDQAGSGFWPIDAFRGALQAVIGLFIGSALVLWIAELAEIALRREAMGFGDVKFLGAIGAFAGWQGGVFAVFGGALIGTCVFACAMVFSRLFGRRPPAPPPDTEDTPKPTEGAEEEAVAFGRETPFGPMLAAGALLYFLWLHPWVDAYFADVQTLLYELR